MYHFIYPSKDAYIYELNTNNEKNFGGDDTLVLKKDFDVASLNGVSRVLLQFDLSELSSSIVSNKIPTDAKYYLRLYERKSSELSPTYSLTTFPLSSSWENGSGYTEQNPNSRNGVSWLRTDESFDSTNWSANTSSLNAVVNSSSLYLDGTGDYVNSTTDAGLPDGNDVKTISAWFRTDSTAYRHIFTYGNLGGGTCFGIGLSGGSIWVNSQSTGQYTVGSGFNDLKWHHLVWTFDTSQVAKTYVDGVEEDSRTWDNQSNLTLGQGIHIGARLDGGAEYFDGYIDEVSIFDKVMSPTEVSSIYNDGKPTDLSNESGLVGYWRFEGNANDLSSNSNDGTLIDDAVLNGTVPFSYPIDSGSRTTGGGVWYRGNGECSQSFSYESPDVNMDVSDIVNNWLDNSISNNGLILKWSRSQEDSTDKTGEIEFYSFAAASVYSPRIEARWSDLTYSTTLTELTTDGTKDNYLYMMDLRKTYRETETVKFRVGGRERYQTKSASTTKSTSSVNVIPNGKGWYSILDVETGNTLIPFGDNSKLSADNASSYFKLNLNGFITNRLYRIVLRLQLTDGRYRIFDDSFDFRVVN